MYQLIERGVYMLTFKKKKRYWAFAFIAINLILLITFFLVPVLLGFYYSLTDYNGSTTPSFIGLSNFQELFQDASFYRSLSRTLLYTVVSVPLHFIIPLFIAILLTRKHTRGKTFSQLIIFLPWLVSPIVAGVTWRWIFGESFGFINYIIERFNGTPLAWSSDGNLAFLVIVLASTWGGTAFNVLLFMSGIKNIPSVLYEAADIDGATGWQKFWSITLPSLKPTSFMVILITTIAAMKEFALIQALNDGGPGTDNTFIVQYIYNTGFDRSRVGYASAVSMVLFVILLLLALFQLQFENKGGK